LAVSPSEGSVRLYGIPNCDQVKKARAWLKARSVPFAFHDFKKHGLPVELAQEWLKRLGTDTLINRKGTTWRALPDARKALVDKASGAIALIMEQPSLVKRPVLAWQAHLSVGFDPEKYATLFS
jgi:arsenate reductase